MTAGLLTLTLMSMMLLVRPIAALTIIALAAVTAIVRIAMGEHRRREALATRADYERRVLMGRRQDRGATRAGRH